MEYEQLPQLNTPREAHRLELCNGEYTVFGGHTTGFVSTPTVEYFRHGKWHTVKTLYPHDAGFAVKLQSGHVMLGGGYEKTFGVGQTWGVAETPGRLMILSDRTIIYFGGKRGHPVCSSDGPGSSVGDLPR